MISNMSSAAAAGASTNFQQYSALHNVPSSSKGATSNEDTVQLSAQAQQQLASTKASAPAPQPSFDQIIKEAADGNIAALVKLALVG